MLTFVFYGGMLLGILGAILGIAYRSWGWILASLIGFLPYVLYLSATPRFTGYFMVVILPLAAIWALRSRQLLAARVLMILFGVGLILPFMMLT